MIPNAYVLLSVSMAMDKPPPNSGFFNSAHDFAVINGHFTELTEINNHFMCL
jgi:hypothetical protein